MKKKSDEIFNIKSIPPFTDKGTAIFLSMEYINAHPGMELLTICIKRCIMYYLLIHISQSINFFLVVSKCIYIYSFLWGYFFPTQTQWIHCTIYNENSPVLSIYTCIIILIRSDYIHYWKYMYVHKTAIHYSLVHIHN